MYRPTYRVERFARSNRRLLAVEASSLTMDEASTLAAQLRLTADENEVGFTVRTAPLAEQAAAAVAELDAVAETPAALDVAGRFEPAPPAVRRAITNAARAAAMRAAHRTARIAYGGAPWTPYRQHLAAALRTPEPRRCALAVLRRQALAWARVALATGARFDVAAKAAGALTFSADSNLASLAVPSKLTGTSAYQDAAAAVALRLDARGGWAVCQRGEACGSDPLGVSALGFRLGAVQPKHAGWIQALPTARVAVTAVTGGPPL